MNIVAAGALVCSAFTQVHNRCGEYIHLVFAALQGEARRIEGPGRVGPVQMTDQPHLTESQFLASDAKQNGGRFGLAKLHIGLTQVHRVFKRGTVGRGVLPEDLCVLRLKLEPHPVGRAHAHIESNAVQGIGIASVDIEPATIKAFNAHPILTAEAEPRGERPIDVAQQRLRRGLRGGSGPRRCGLSKCRKIEHGGYKKTEQRLKCAFQSSLLNTCATARRMPERGAGWVARVMWMRTKRLRM